MTDNPTPIAPPPALEGLLRQSPEAVEALRVMRLELERCSGLDEATIELARIAALIALGGPAESIQAHVKRARAVGLGAQQVWGVVMAVAPLVGVPRIVATAPAVTSALG